MDTYVKEKNAFKSKLELCRMISINSWIITLYLLIDNSISIILRHLYFCYNYTLWFQCNCDVESLIDFIKCSIINRMNILILNQLCKLDCVISYKFVIIKLARY